MVHLRRMNPYPILERFFYTAKPTVLIKFLLKNLCDVLPYNNYPMLIETGQVFIIDYTKKDGSIERMYYRSDGNERINLPKNAMTC